MDLDRLARWYATLMVFFLPVRALGLFGQGSLTPGVLLSVLMAGPIVATCTRYRKLVLVLVATGLCLVSAPVLVALSAREHEIDVTNAWATSSFLAIGVWSFLATLWARQMVGARAIAVAFSLGVALQGLLTPSQWSGDPWKYAFAWPVAVLFAALIQERNSRWLTVIATGAVAMLSTIFDYRSFIGFCALGLTIFLWRWNRVNRLSRSRVMGSFAILVGAAYAVYKAGIWLSLNGYLGLRNQLVTAAQIDAGGSALAAGRSESGAAFSLFAYNPFGFGPGVVPTSNDAIVAKTGLLSRGADINGTYVNDYLLGDGFKLHSVLGDFWVNFGVAGLALGAIFLGLLLVMLVAQISARRPAFLPIFVVLVGLWDMLFSPLGSNLHEVLFALALGLQPNLRADHSKYSEPRRKFVMERMSVFRQPGQAIEPRSMTSASNKAGGARESSSDASGPRALQREHLEAAEGK